MTHLVENYLYKIDTAFANKDEKEILMIYVMIFGGLFALSYFLFWESAQKSYEITKSSVTQQQTKIQADQAYLQSNPESQISVIESQTEQIKQNLAKKQESNDYIKHRIERISELYYDEQTWGEYINSISRHAKQEHIHISELTNTITDEKETFGHVLDITVKADGTYKNMLRFINKLEQSFLVVDLHDFNFTAEEKLQTDLNISVWGITYK